MNQTQDLLATLQSQYPLPFRGVQPLREVGGTAFAVHGGGRWVLKLARPAFQDTFRQGVDVMLYLAERGFPVPKIVPTKDGQPRFTYEGRCAVLFEYIEGKEPKRRGNEGRIGELVGQLHALMREYPGPLKERGKAYFVGRYLEQLRQKDTPSHILEQFERMGDALWARAERLPRGYCHGDMHIGNLLQTRQGGLYALDFDASCRAFPLYDVAVMCDTTDYFGFDAKGYGRSARSFARFLEGYEKHRPLSEAERMAFFDCVALRHYRLQATILELFGLDCVDGAFVERQLDWLLRWREQCNMNKGR